MNNSFKKLLVNNKGLALVEFALCLPLLLVLFFGTFELARFILIMQKVERTAYSLASIVSQYQPAGTAGAAVEDMISVANMTNNVFPQVINMMIPYNDAAGLRTIVTSVSNRNTGKRINWQIASADTNGSFTKADVRSIVNNRAPSAINPSVKNKIATFNPEILLTLSTMTLNENMIIVEVFYDYQPLLSNELSGFKSAGFGRKTIISRSYTMPRQGNLLTLPPDF